MILKVAFTLLMLVVLAFAIAYAWGTALPAAHTATSSRVIPAPPLRVAAVIRDPARYPQWRPSVHQVEVTDRSDTFQTFVEVGRHGRITYRSEESKRGQIFVNTIADKSLPFQGQWVITLAAAGPEATRVTIVEAGSVPAPFLRFLSHYFFNQEATLSEYLSDLEMAFEGASS